MRKAIIGLAIAISAPAAAQVYVPGYVRSDGTYVQPHQRTRPDSNPYNNYSAQGNSSPYTGRAGAVRPYQNNQLNSLERSLSRKRARSGF